MAKDILTILAIFLWCLTGTFLLNRLPLLSDPRLRERLHRGAFPVSTLLITAILIAFWPVGKRLSGWLTRKSH
jgi:hypothetical protein